MDMLKKKERKDDGRYIIFYEFAEGQDSNLGKDSNKDRIVDNNIDEDRATI